MKNRFTPVAISLAVAFASTTLATSAYAEEPQINTKILNGESATQPSADLLLPWQAALLTAPQLVNGTHIITSGCGAVVISDYWAVTAAHCISPLMSGTLVTGVDILKNSSGNANDLDDRYKFTVVDVKIHDGYFLNSALDHDIALLKVDRSMLDVAKPIKLATPHEQKTANDQFVATWNSSGYSEPNLIASGWGYTEPKFDQPDKLMFVKLGGIPMSECNASHYPLSEESHFVCADSSDPDVKKDVCRGDSGGPLVWQDPSKAGNSDFGLRVIGVTSNGPYCHEKEAGNPNAQQNGLYTELAHYYEWIEAQTGLTLAAQPTSDFNINPFAKELDNKTRKGSSGGGGSLPLSGLISLTALALLRRKTL